MIDIKKKYRTRAGQEVKILSVESPEKGYPVVAAYKTETDWEVECFDENGFYYGVEFEPFDPHRSRKSTTDLIEVDIWEDEITEGEGI